jgi:hypothetical protein
MKRSDVLEGVESHLASGIAALHRPAATAATVIQPSNSKPTTAPKHQCESRLKPSASAS